MWTPIMKLFAYLHNSLNSMLINLTSCWLLDNAFQGDKGWCYNEILAEFHDIATMNNL